MTTVGYGDLVPITPGGQMMGAAASIAGIMVMTIPISMIVEKFAEAQEKIHEQQERERKMSTVE